MRRLWKGLLVGSLLGGLAYLTLRRRPGWRRGMASAQRFGRRTAWSLGRQWRDAQGAWRIGRKVMRRRRFLSGVRKLTRRLIGP